MSDVDDPFTVVLATRNQNKIKEILAIFQDASLRFLTLDDFPGAPDVVEDSPTLEGNAQKKAYEMAHFTQQIALADDSGLEVDFLDGMPGVISARFAGKGCSYGDNNNKLLRLLKNAPPAKRTAKFVCVMALYDNGKLIEAVRGECAGKIATEPRGKSGFGYDPVFIPKGYLKTYAELPRSTKNRISHRGRALQAAKKIILKFCRT